MSQQLAEKFTVSCPQCGKAVGVTRAHIGKKGRCPKCQNVFPIQAPAEIRSSRDEVVPGAIELEPINPDLGQGANSIWSDVGALPAFPSAPLPSQGWPAEEPRLQEYATLNANAAFASEYLNKARTDKGGTIQQIEDEDMQYRFWTSWGSVIGGISTICLGLFFLLFLLLFFFSPRLMAACVIMIIAGVGWLVQGMNYVTYYRWKEKNR